MKQSPAGTVELLTGAVVDQSPIVVAPPPSGSSLGSQIVRNVLFGGLRYLLVFPVPFVMTPLILHKIGVAGYGTWAVFLAINGLTSLADLGLMGTLSKFVAEYHAMRDVPALTKALSSGLSLFLLLDSVIVSALWFAVPLLTDRLFRGSPVARGDLIKLLHLFLIVVACNILTQLLASVTTGLQRLDLSNLIGAANVISSSVFAAGLLLRGWGLTGLVYGYCASALLTVLAYVVAIRRLLPHIVPNPLLFDTAEARKMFSFSLRLYVTQAAVVVHNQIEKVYLGMLVGVAAVGWYDMAGDIALKVRGALGFILGPVLPAASELNALGDESRTRELFYRTHKYLALGGVPVVCFVTAVSHRFVQLWVGSGLAVIALPLAILLIVNFINLATGPGFLIFAGGGNLKPGVQSASLAIGLNVVLSLGLIYKFGFAGAVVGTSVSLIFASGYFMLVFHRISGYPILRLLRESYLKPVGCALAALVLALAVRPTRDLSWFGLASIGVLFGAFYSILILVTRFFDACDWNRIEGVVPAIRRARRLISIA